MRKYFLSLSILLVVCFVVSPVVFAQQDTPDLSSNLERKTITSVEVKGNKIISLSSILAKIKTRAGQDYSSNIVSDDIKRLYDTGYFSNVKIDREPQDNGYKVIFVLEEKQVIEDITFSRLRYYKPNHLLRKIQAKKGKFFDGKVLRDDMKTIRELYEKKGLMDMDVRVEQDVDVVTNKVKLHFVITEGDRVKIKKLVFQGNESYRDKRLIKVIKTRKDGLFNSGYLKEDVLEEDLQRVRAFYEKEGFIDVQVTHKLDEYRPGRIEVAILVEEGKQYFVDTVTVKGNKIFSQGQILDVMTEIQPGKIFSRDRLSIDLAEIRSKYYDEGYIFANVSETMAINPDTGKVVVSLDIYEGGPAYVNKIKIEGNTRTRDIVIRRELRLYPGDKFDGSKLRRSKERLRNLGYFNEINYDTEDTQLSDHKNLIVQVEEAKTGSFNFGGGYSTVDNLVGFVEIEQKNFDFTNWPTFTGGGQHLVFRTETSATRNNFRLSFTEPWILDYPISGGFDAYITQRDRERDVGYAYDEDRKGGRIRFSKQTSEYVNVGTYYQYENIQIDNFEDNVSAELLREQGENNLSMVGLSVSRDTRDNVFNPTKGLYLEGAVDVAGGPVAGDKDFYRFIGKASYDIPVKGDMVLEFRLKTGIMDEYGDSEYVPIYERFFAGGSRTIRGYEERKVGPLDSVTDDPIGGESMIVGNVELTVPVLEFMKLAAFYDVGNVWKEMNDIGNGGYKSGVGMGLRFKTPVGPINLDYGYPLNDEPGEESRSGKFYFSVSRGF